MSTTYIGGQPRQLARPGAAVLAANDNFTVPAGVYQLKTWIIGGGGGSVRGGLVPFTRGGNGGAGALVMQWGL